MFEIHNKRKQFWQWDTGQRLIVNADMCSEVHFCNGVSDCSMVCRVYEEDGLRLVNVPNILLQMPKAIKVYSYICDGEEKYTELQRIFSVFPRSKPDDYSYTEVEIERYETLEARISELEKNGGGGSGGTTEVTAESIKNALGYTPADDADVSKLSDEIADLKENGTGGGAVISAVEPAEDDIPKVFFGSALQQTKDEAVVPFRYISKTDDFSGYAEIKAQGNSSMKFPKKNQTVKLFKDVECAEKLKVDFKGWGKQNKHVYKANWIDLSHARNVVSARLWGDVVKSRANYAELPELFRNTPNQGAVDGFPVKVYAAGVYQGRYTLNIPKDKWTFNMDDELDNHCVLCGENYVSGCFRAAAEIDESDWTDEIHDVVPASIKTRWNQVISFVMNSTDDEFKANLGNYFYVDSLIDYYLFGLASCGLDAFGKNQIYATYDGQKWIASMYDMDSTWGLYYDGSKIVEVDYGRDEYEDFVNTNGNLLYIRLERLFGNEIRSRWAELRNSVLSIENIVNRFERFTDIASAALVAEDYASTTGGGKFIGIPSKTTSNIQQIRSFALGRQFWTDGYVNGLVYIPCTGITLPASTLTFSGAGTKTLTATVTPDDCTENVVWTSDNTAVATVSNGVVTPVADGDCTIKAQCGAYSATCAVSVSNLSTYTVTNNLTNVNTDNTSTTAFKNGSYTANLTVSNEYALDSVTVIMGGNDITATAYNNGIIYIEEVTGDIVITATAKSNGIIYRATNLDVTKDVDTGVTLMNEDKDFTIVYAATLAADSTVGGSYLFADTKAATLCAYLQPSRLGAMYTSATPAKLDLTDCSFTTGDSFRAVFTHTAGDSGMNIYMSMIDTETNTSKTYNKTATGDHSNTTNTLKICSSNGAIQFVDEVAIYSYAMTAEEANAWLAK